MFSSPLSLLFDTSLTYLLRPNVTIPDFHDARQATGNRGLYLPYKNMNLMSPLSLRTMRTRTLCGTATGDTEAVGLTATEQLPALEPIKPVYDDHLCLTKKSLVAGRAQRYLTLKQGRRNDNEGKKFTTDPDEREWLQLLSVKISPHLCNCAKDRSTGNSKIISTCPITIYRVSEPLNSLFGPLGGLQYSKYVIQ